VNPTIKKILKVTSITLLCAILLLAAVGGVACYMVFTPSRLTPMVRQSLPNYVNCLTEVDEVELTFFSTFPHFGIQMQHVALVNPKEGAQSDTLLRVNQLTAVIDLDAYWKSGKIDIQAFHLTEGEANLYVARDGSVNYDVLISDDQSSDSSTVTLDEIALHNVALSNFNLTYRDQAAQMSADLEHFSLSVSGESHLQRPSGDILLRDITAQHLRYADTIYQADLLSIALPECRLNVNTFEQIKSDFSLTVDSLALSMSGLSTRFDNLTLADAHLEMNKGYQAQFQAKSTAWTLDMDGEGRLVNAAPIELSTQLTADEAFTALHFGETRARFVNEEATLQADVLFPDSITTRADLSLTLQPTTFARLLQLVPAAYAKSLQGMTVQGDLGATTLTASVDMRGDAPLDIDKFAVKTAVSNFDFAQGKTLLARSEQFRFDANYPAGRNTRRMHRHQESQFIEANLTGAAMHVEMHDSTDLVADVPNATLQMRLSDEVISSTSTIPYVDVSFSLDQLDALSDTLTLQTHNLQGNVKLAEGRRHAKQYYQGNFECNDIDVAMGNALKAVSGPLQLEATSIYDSKEKDLLLRYNPVVKVNLKKGNVAMTGVPYPFVLPTIDFDFNLGHFQIRDGQLQYGNSDFQLHGDIDNLRNYLQKTESLVAKLELKSHTTDVYQLLDLVDMFNVADTAAVAQQSEATDYINERLTDLQTVSETNTTAANDTATGNPFMVPERIDLQLTTHIDQSIVGENLFRDLAGRLYIRDGALILEEMGFSSKAARMQLTAMYKSPRRNHLFVGANFHLLDIEVADLIRMIPEVDSIVPMLKSFDGKAEFHLAAETNLNSHYDPKLSTLMATAAIEGQNLTVLDNETFETMKKYLFKEKTRNVIDTLSVEMAVSRKKATVYPMRIAMDRYEAVVSGQHLLTGDMGFNYHISLTKTPALIPTLGLDITGDMTKPEDFEWKIVGCKYASMYKPERRNVTQAQTLELKKMISDALKKTVK